MAEAGRPTKATPETIALLITSFSNGSTVAEACTLAKIDDATFYRWMNSDKDFAVKIADAKDLISNIAKGNLAQKIVRGDVPVSQWWLERKKKSEFSARQEITGEDGKDIVVKVIDYGNNDQPST